MEAGAAAMSGGWRGGMGATGPARSSPVQAPALVGHLGRKGLRLALTDRNGVPQLSAMRSYSADDSSSVSGTLTAYQRTTGLDRLPERIALAVAGMPRGDTISITKTRWIVSRSGLQAMLGQPPLILNDFEAEAWALAGQDGCDLHPIGGSARIALSAPGSYGIVGMTSGLGVSVLRRDKDGGVGVIATEAGHGSFAPGSRGMAELTAAMSPDRYPLAAEHLISASGLCPLSAPLSARKDHAKRPTPPEAITRSVATDPLAREACGLLCEAFATHLGSLVLTLGTWDGVIVTGNVAKALLATLGTERMRAHFRGTGKYARLLQQVPINYCTINHGELIGAAHALRTDAAQLRPSSAGHRCPGTQGQVEPGPA